MPFDLHGTERLLHSFGTEIKSLSISFDVSNGLKRAALSVILATYCTGSSCQLEKLITNNTQIHSACPDILRPIFQRLKQLKFSSPLQNSDDVLDQLNGSGILQRLDISCKLLRDDASVYRILSKFPNLQQLELTPMEKYSIGRMMTHSHDMVSCVATMENLTDSNVGDWGRCLYDLRTVFDLLADTAVQRLNIAFFTDQLMLGQIQTMKHITVLEFKKVCSSAALLDLIVGLPNLNELCFECKYVSTNFTKTLAKCETLTKLSFTELRNPINDDDFDEILASVNGRKTKKKLTIKIDCPTSFLQVAKTKIDTHREFLEIEMVDHRGFRN